MKSGETPESSEGSSPDTEGDLVAEQAAKAIIDCWRDRNKVPINNSLSKRVSFGEVAAGMMVDGQAGFTNGELGQGLELIASRESGDEEPQPEFTEEQPELTLRQEAVFDALMDGGGFSAYAAREQAFNSQP